MDTTVHPLTETINKAREHLDLLRYEEALELLQVARREQTEGAPDADLEDLHYSLALCLNQLERPAEALPYARKAHRLAEKARDAVGQARALEQLGTAAYKKNDYQNALELYQRSYKLWESTEEMAGRARCLRDIGSIQSDLQQNEESEDSFRQAKKLFEQVEDEEGVVACLTNIGLLYYRSEGSEGALKSYKESIEKEEIEHYLLYNNTGFLHLVEGQFDEAREYLEKGKKDLDKRGAEDDNAALLSLNLGIVSAMKGENERSLELFDAAQKLFEQHPEGRAVEVVLCAVQDRSEFDPYVVVDDAHKVAITHLNRAAVLVALGRLDEALEHANKGVELDRNLPYPYFCLGWVQLAKEAIDEAIRAFKRASGMAPNNTVYKQALEAINPFYNSKVGRNEPCPCGSGKKFKKCHGKG